MSLVTQKCRLEWGEGIEHLQVWNELDIISFLLYHAFFNLPFLLTPPPASLSSPITPYPPPPISASPFLKCSPTFLLLHLLLSRSPLFFSSAQQEWARLEDRGFTSSSQAHKRSAARLRRPCRWNRFSLQIVCALCRVFESPSPQLPPLLQP